jgi:diguanylate cyclase (GGDEF)-like protein
VRRRRWRHRIAVAAALSVAVLGAGVLVRHFERSAFRDLEQTFRQRAAAAEPFLRWYVQDILARERSLAESKLSGSAVAQRDLDTLVQTFGFEAAVVTDASGKLIAVHPARAEIVGDDLTTSYSHLRMAQANGSAVSAVVPSVSKSTPVVAFAARYSTPHGARVLSGAFDVSSTPVQSYLKQLGTLPGMTADIVDSSGWIVASSRALDTTWRPLTMADEPLADEVRSGSRSGRYTRPEGHAHFVALPIAGTPWLLIMSVDEVALYAPVADDQRWATWLLFGALALVPCLAGYLLMRLLSSRSELQAMNAELDRIARVDRLTDVPNRRELEEQLARMQSAGSRHQRPFSVLIVDVDHFKRINDEYGHAAGDSVLKHLARAMASGLRLEDVFGRWGGEEFLVLLPNTCAQGAAIAAERVRKAANSCTAVVDDSRAVCATVSIGCATSSGPPDATLLQRADAALYRAKRSGRNRVATSDPPPLAMN